MAQHKQFNPTVAIEKAMHLFWKQGYTATSIRDLVRATSIQRADLYSAFGDKHGLFLQALDHYHENVMGQMVAGLEAVDSSLPEIESFFANLIALSREELTQYGCLMCNSSTELALHDSQVVAKMTRYENRLIVAFQGAVERAQTAGSLGIGVDSKEAGTYLMGITVAFWRLVKSPLPRTASSEYVQIALDGLRTITHS